MSDAGPLDMNIFGSVKQEMTRCWSDAALAGERLFWGLQGCKCSSRDRRERIIQPILFKAGLLLEGIALRHFSEI